MLTICGGQEWIPKSDEEDDDDVDEDHVDHHHQEQQLHYPHAVSEKNLFPRLKQKEEEGDERGERRRRSVVFVNFKSSFHSLTIHWVLLFLISSVWVPKQRFIPTPSSWATKSVLMWGSIKPFYGWLNYKLTLSPAIHAWEGCWCSGWRWCDAHVDDAGPTLHYIQNIMYTSIYLQQVSPQRYSWCSSCLLSCCWC